MDIGRPNTKYEHCGDKSFDMYSILGNWEGKERNKTCKYGTIAVTIASFGQKHIKLIDTCKLLILGISLTLNSHGWWSQWLLFCVHYLKEGARTWR